MLQILEDYIRAEKELVQLIEQSEEVRRYVDRKKFMDDIRDQDVTVYAVYRMFGGGPIEVEQAADWLVKRRKELFPERPTNPEVEHILSKLSPEERRLFQK